MLYILIPLRALRVLRGENQTFYDAVNDETM
jgi:hypothetical protein